MYDFFRSLDAYKFSQNFPVVKLVEKGLEKDMIGTLHLQVRLKLLEGTMIQFVLLLEVRIFQLVVPFLYCWLVRVQMVIVKCDRKPACHLLPERDKRIISNKLVLLTMPHWHTLVMSIVRYFAD